jgi:hypothetical protein
VTPFAGDEERIQPGSRDVEHEFSIGEQTAKISTGVDTPSPAAASARGRVPG